MRIALCALVLASVARAQDVVKHDNAPEAWAIGAVEARWADSVSPRYGSAVMVGPDLVLTQLECMDRAVEAKFTLPCCGDHAVLGIAGVYEKEHIVLLRIQQPERASPMEVSSQIPAKGQGWHFSISLVEDMGVLSAQFKVLEVREWPADGLLAWTRMPQTGFMGSGVALDDQKRVRGLCIGTGGNKTTLFSMIRPEMAKPGKLTPLAEFAAREASSLIKARRLADAAMAAGTASSIPDFREALRLEPQLWRAQWYLGVVLDLSGESDAALLELAKASALTPWFSEPLYSTGLVHLKGKRMEEAVTWFDKATAVDDEYAGAHSMKAVALFNLDRKEEAIAAGRRSIASKTADWQHYNNLVVFLKRMDRLEEGLDVLRQFCRDEPRDIRGWQALGHHLREKEDFKEAERVLLEGIEHVKSVELYKELLVVRVHVKDVKGSLEVVNKILDLEPVDAEKFKGIKEFLEEELAKEQDKTPTR